MSRLKVFAPRETDFVFRIHTENDDPVILSFKPRSRTLPRHHSAALLNRARVLRENNRCPHCGHGVVEPVDLGDARFDRALRPIPCTSTLVGFACERCENEWAV